MIRKVGWPHHLRSSPNLTICDFNGQLLGNQALWCSSQVKEDNQYHSLGVQGMISLPEVTGMWPHEPQKLARMGQEKGHRRHLSTFLQGGCIYHRDMAHNHFHVNTVLLKEEQSILKKKVNKPRKNRKKWRDQYQRNRLDLNTPKDCQLCRHNVHCNMK